MIPAPAEAHITVLTERLNYLKAKREMWNAYLKREIAALEWAIEQLTPL